MYIVFGSGIIYLKNLKWALLVVVCAYALVIWSRTPSQEGNWIEDVSKLSVAQWSENNRTFTLQNIRNWQYSQTKIVDKSYFDKSYNLDELESLWLYVQPIGLGEAIAHTFLVFKFKGNIPENYLGISIETRLEVGESYSPVAGILRKLELHYTWATENDLVERRAIHLHYPLKRYKIKAENIHMQALLRKLLATTNALANTPRWYNTLLDNCTNELLKSVNAVYANTIPLHYSFVLTGYVDAYLDNLGYIDKRVPMLYITKTWLKRNMLR